MRVFVQEEPARMEVLVWLIEDRSAEPRIFYPAREYVPGPDAEDLDPLGPAVKVIEEGTNLSTMPPSMRLPRDAFKALIEAGGDFAPPDRAVAQHRDDAVRVRDRLLTLVEAGWKAA